jgi:hypothetical protein
VIDNSAKNLFLKRALHWIGSALAFFGVVFVVTRLRDYGAAIDFSSFDKTQWIIIFNFILLYCAANLFLARAWWYILQHLSVLSPLRWAIKAYGISQLARYVPGNLFHFAGRQAMGVSAGISGWALAKSSVWELSLISIAGSLFTLLTLPLFVSTSSIIVLSPAVFVTVLIGAVNLLWRIISPSIAKAFLCHIAFLIISGAIFTLIFMLKTEEPFFPLLHWSSVCGAFILAWLSGLIMPGAPAGIGIRELVLLFLLKGVVAEDDLIFIIVAGRMVTVCGDFLFYLFSYILPNSNSSVA